MSDKLTPDAQALLTMLSSSCTGLWDWHINKCKAYYSDEWLALVGMPPGVFEPNIEFRNSRVHPDDIIRVNKALQAFLCGKGVSHIDFRIKNACGTWLQVRETIVVTERDEDKVVL